MLNHYHIVLAVGAFIRDSENRILIVKKSPYEKVDGGLWTIPGGKVSPKEQVFNALKREVKEEVGLEVIKYQWIGEDVFENNSYWFHGEHFLCKVKKISPVVLEKNLLEYKWISKKEIHLYEFHPNIKKRLLEVIS